MPADHYERAFQAWPVLTERAGQRSTITYGELGEALHIHHRPVRLVLGIIQDLCIREHLPPLTILVVKKDGKRPGAGFIAWDPGRLDEGYEEVYQFPWGARANPLQFAAQGGVTPDDLAREVVTRPQDAAEVYQKVKSRGMAQVVFRLALLSAYRHQCGFCGLSLDAALQAAHIIPWPAATPGQRVSPANGLLLCSTHHALFDAGILSVSPARSITCQRDKLPGHRWTTADQRAAADLDGQPVRLPDDRRLWPDAEALAYLAGRRPGGAMAVGQAGTGQRQEVWAGRDGYAAGRDLTVNVYSSPESPGAAAGLHEPSGGAPAGVEVIVRRRFAVDWGNGLPRLVGAQALVANNSAASVTVTKIGLKPVGFPGPSKLISGNIAEKVEPGSALTCALQLVDFSDVLDHVSASEQPGEPAFLVYAETSYGSAVKAYHSEPFSMTPKSTRPLDDGFTEWTE